MVEELNRIIDEIPPCFLQFSLTSTKTSSLEITKTFWNKMLQVLYKKVKKYVKLERYQMWFCLEN